MAAEAHRSFSEGGGVMNDDGEFYFDGDWALEVAEREGDAVTFWASFEDMDRLARKAGYSATKHDGKYRLSTVHSGTVMFERDTEQELADAVTELLITFAEAAMRLEADKLNSVEKADA